MHDGCARGRASSRHCHGRPSAASRASSDASRLRQSPAPRRPPIPWPRPGPCSVCRPGLRRTRSRHGTRRSRGTSRPSWRRPGRRRSRPPTSGTSTPSPRLVGCWRPACSRRTSWPTCRRCSRASGPTRSTCPTCGEPWPSPSRSRPTRRRHQGGWSGGMTFFIFVSSGLARRLCVLRPLHREDQQGARQGQRAIPSSPRPERRPRCSRRPRTLQKAGALINGKLRLCNKTRMPVPVRWIGAVRARQG